MDTLWNGLDTTAAAVLRCSLQATLLIPAVVAVRWVTGKWSSAAARRFLWWIVVGRLLLPWSPSAPFSVFEVLDFGGWTTLRGAGQSASAAGTARLERPTPAALALEPTRSAEPDAEAVSVARASGPTSSPLPSWNVGRALAGVWALGFLTVLGLTALDGTRMRRWVRTRTMPAGAETSALLDDCRRRMGVRFPIAVRVGTWVRSPAVWGLWRPTVLLPAELESSAGVERLRHVLLHESAHVARRDLAWGLVLRFVQALHWFNPVVPWLLRRMRVEREIATDAKVLEATGAAERSAYGETLLALLEGAAARPPVFTGTAVGTTDGPADMEARIRAIATFTPTCGAGGRLAIGMAVALAMVCWTDAIPSAAPEKGASTKPRLGPAGELLPGGEDLGPGWSNRVTSLVDRGSPALEYFDPGVFEPARKAIRSHVPEGGAFCDSSYYRGSNFVFDAWLRRHESTNAVEDAWRNLRNAPLVPRLSDGKVAKRSSRRVADLEAVLYEADVRTLWMAAGRWMLNLNFSGKNPTDDEVFAIAEVFARRLGAEQPKPARSVEGPSPGDAAGWYVVNFVGDAYTRVRRVHTNRVALSRAFSKPDGSHAYFTITNAESVPILVWNVRVQVKTDGTDGAPGGWTTVSSDYPSCVSGIPAGATGDACVLPPSRAPWRVALLYTAQSLDGRPIPDFPPHLRGDHEVFSAIEEAAFE